MTANNQYDVIIIGTGAGGGSLARHLAPSGKRILLLERGEFLPREKENWEPRERLINRRYMVDEKWLDGGDKPFNPEIYYNVGGNTKNFGAALFRFRKEDFQEQQHYDGISPEWPIPYEDIEPYYTLAEQMYCVHGQRGTDPTEPFASAPYAHPPVSHEPKMQELFDAFGKIGCNPFPMPVGVQLNEQDMPNSKCIRCDTCEAYPCLVHAKSDAEVIGVRPALKSANVTLVTNAKVTRLETSSSGREVKAVHVERNGEPVTYQGDIVIVSAGACNSAKLLLMSSNDKHPNGLANGSDQVGRNFMFHNTTFMMAFANSPNPTRFQKTLALNDFYFGINGFKHPCGHIQMLGRSKPELYRRVLPRFVPMSMLRHLASRAYGFVLFTEDLPDPNSRLTVTADGQIKINYVWNNMEPMRQLVQHLKKLLKQIAKTKTPFSKVRTASTLGQLPALLHQCGTVRFGNDPATSVLDANCKAHELDNLYVVDGSPFPSSAAVNPALTIIANALRVGDHLLDRLK